MGMIEWNGQSGIHVLPWHCSLDNDLYLLYMLPFWGSKAFMFFPLKIIWFATYLMADIAAIINPEQFISNSFSQYRMVVRKLNTCTLSKTDDLPVYIHNILSIIKNKFSTVSIQDIIPKLFPDSRSVIEH